MSLRSSLFPLFSFLAKTNISHLANFGLLYNVRSLFNWNTEVPSRFLWWMLRAEYSWDASSSPGSASIFGLFSCGFAAISWTLDLRYTYPTYSMALKCTGTLKKDSNQRPCEVSFLKNRFDSWQCHVDPHAVELIFIITGVSRDPWGQMTRRFFNLTWRYLTCLGSSFVKCFRVP